MKIRFTESRWLDTEDRAKDPLFKKGSTHDLVETSAQRWLRRGVAVEVVAEPVKMKLDRPMMVEKRAFKRPEVAEVFSVDDTKKFRDEMAKVDFGIVEAVVEAETPKKRGRKPKRA